MCILSKKNVVRDKLKMNIQIGLTYIKIKSFEIRYIHAKEFIAELEISHKQNLAEAVYLILNSCNYFSDLRILKYQYYVIRLTFKTKHELIKFNQEVIVDC